MSLCFPVCVSTLTFMLDLLPVHAPLSASLVLWHTAAGAFGAKFGKKGALSKTFVSGHSKAFGKVAIYGHDKGFTFNSVKAAGAAGGAVGGGGKKGSFSSGGHAEGFKKGAVGGKAGFASGSAGSAGFKHGSSGASGYGKKSGFWGKAGGFKTIGLGGGFPAYAHGIGSPSLPYYGFGHEDGDHDAGLVGDQYIASYPTAYGLGTGLGARGLLSGASPYGSLTGGSPYASLGGYESSGPYAYPSVTRYGY